MAKEFALMPPDRFGDWYPYGYPVAGSLLSHLGLSAYNALMAVTAGAYLFMLTMIWRLLPPDLQRRPKAILLIATAVCSPLCTQLLMSNLSEPFFGTVLLALAVSLGMWTKRWAIALSLILALLAFSIRYAGIFAFGVVGLYAIARWKDLRATGTLAFFVGVSLVVLAITAALLWTNFQAFGRITGPQPVGEESLLTWPYRFAHFGWSAVGTFSSSHLIARVEALSPVLMYTIGFAIMGIIAFLLLASWAMPNSVFSRPLVLVTGTYILSIVSLRASTPFDAVSFPRFFLPIYFSLLYLVATRGRLMQSRLFTAAICTSMLLSCALAVRGISAEQLNDLSAVREFLKNELQPGDDVAVNLPARNLAAYFPNRFDYIGNKEGNANAWTISQKNWKPNRTAFTVLAARPTGTISGRRVFQKNEQEAVTSAIESGRVKLVFSNAEAVVVKAHWLENATVGGSP